MSDWFHKATHPWEETDYLPKEASRHGMTNEFRRKHGYPPAVRPGHMMPEEQDYVDGRELCRTCLQLAVMCECEEKR